MSFEPELQESCPPEQFVVPVFSEIPERTIQRRWREVNTVLRLSMLSGLPMQLETAFNMLCDFSSEIVPYEKSVIYFWDETTEQVGLRVLAAKWTRALLRFLTGTSLISGSPSLEDRFSSTSDRIPKPMRCCAPWTQSQR